MSGLEWSEILNRKVRGGTLNELSVPNWAIIQEAIGAGEAQKAGELLDYYRSRSEDAYVRLGVMANELLTVIANTAGEEVIEKIWRARYAPRVADLLRTAGTVEQFLKRMIEVEVGHHSELTVTEEADRYAIKCHLCGSGGRMRRAVTAGTFKKTYPWTWGKVGVAYMCAHCSIELEILPIEARGYPLAITEYNERLEDPCIRLYYKKPDRIPEKYFTRVGKIKDVSKFK